LVSGKTVQWQGFHTASAHRFFLRPLQKYSTVMGLSQNHDETRLIPLSAVELLKTSATIDW
jgi:hypothetical protein